MIRYDIKKVTLICDGAEGKAFINKVLLFLILHYTHVFESGNEKGFSV